MMLGDSMVFEKPLRWIKKVLNTFGAGFISLDKVLYDAVLSGFCTLPIFWVYWAEGGDSACVEFKEELCYHGYRNEREANRTTTPTRFVENRYGGECENYEG